MNSWKIFLLKHSPLQKNFKVSTVIGGKGSHWINYLMFGQPEYRRGIPHLQVSFVVGSGWCNRWAAGEKHRHRHYQQELDHTILMDPLQVDRTLFTCSGKIQLLGMSHSKAMSWTFQIVSVWFLPGGGVAPGRARSRLGGWGGRYRSPCMCATVG